MDVFEGHKADDKQTRNLFWIPYVSLNLLFIQFFFCLLKCVHNEIFFCSFAVRALIFNFTLLVMYKSQSVRADLDVAIDLSHFRLAGEISTPHWPAPKKLLKGGKGSRLCWLLLGKWHSRNGVLLVLMKCYLLFLSADLCEDVYFCGAEFFFSAEPARTKKKKHILTIFVVRGWERL